MSAGRIESWLAYAAENLEVARLALEHGHFNACLQNVQQAVEKDLKAIVVSGGKDVRKTHDIILLLKDLGPLASGIDLERAEAQFINSIYASSKYPIESALPDAPPTADDCRTAIAIAERVRASVQKLLATATQEPRITP